MTKARRHGLLLGYGLLVLVVGLVSTADHWFWPIIGGVKRKAYFQGKPTSYWVHWLDNQTPGVDPSQMLEDGWPESSPVILEMLQQRSGSAFIILGRLGPKAKSALPAIMELKRKNPGHDGIHLACDDLIRKIEAKDRPQEPPNPGLEVMW